MGVQPRPLKFSGNFSCAPIDLIKSFFTLHWLWLHGSNSPYVRTLSDATRRQRRCTAARPSQQKSASLLNQCAVNGFDADVYKAHSNFFFFFFCTRLKPHMSQLYGWIIVLHIQKPLACSVTFISVDELTVGAEYVCACLSKS